MKKILKELILAILSKRLKWFDLAHIINLKVKNSYVLFKDKKLDFFYHTYNNMGRTERTAEIPLIGYYLREKKFNNVLEIGNVTNYYEDYFVNLIPRKTVVDKLEVSQRTITKDIAEYYPLVKFDFIFSISTFEHMDSDLGRNKDYIAGTSKYGTIAADNIVHCYENMLENGGLLVITAPLGYTPEWDLTFKSDILEKFNFTSLRKYLVKRINNNIWEEMKSWDRNYNYSYGFPLPYANFVTIIEITK